MFNVLRSTMGCWTENFEGSTQMQWLLGVVSVGRTTYIGAHSEAENILALWKECLGGALTHRWVLCVLHLGGGVKIFGVIFDRPRPY